MLELKDIHVRAGGHSLFTLDHLVLGKGLYALVGRNGTGKSTFLRTVLGEHADYAGSIRMIGRDLPGMSKRERARLIAVVYSSAGLFGHHTVREVLLLGRLPYQGLFARETSEDQEVVERITGLLGLDELVDRRFNRLSDGEKQLVMIGRALVQDTPVLVLDEPAAFLDLVNRYNLMKILRRIVSDTGKLVIFSTHQVDLLESSCDGVLLIAGNQMQFLDEPAQFAPVIHKTFGLL